ncbi:Mg2+ transporter protein, CorA-like/Zinc transport protein ZntB [Dillenia turbinata]|uniref:Magnesium transporter n=1 Tax=Dillenia turbinata TaxID=194707 RepID=A0AAN8V4J3_9MAGN
MASKFTKKKKKNKNLTTNTAAGEEDLNSTIHLPRRKGTGVRQWLVISEYGERESQEVGKHYIMKRTGLPHRDLRVLDPKLSYPSSILGRERAIVINLEHIKAIITAKEVLILNSTNPLVALFVDDLRHRVSSSSLSPKQASDGGDLDDMPHSKMGEPRTTGPKVLPFEFRALEACLESACRCLESETQTLEQEAYPALDELTSKISTLNLERVRQIKSRLAAISGRVQKVRDEIEQLLDDDNDMAEMYLTEKLDHLSSEQSSPREDPYKDEFQADDKGIAEAANNEHDFESFTTTKPNIEELEMLLEAYFVQIDGILQKLSTMSEYVDDTEDYINIMLDDKQNQLLQMGVMLSTATMVLNGGIVVAGIFGMNFHTLALFVDGQQTQFLQTTLGTVGGCVALFFIALGWGMKKKLLAL